MTYKFLEHTADIKFHAEGKTLEEAFINSAMALKESIVGKIKIKEIKKKEILAEGEDKESLLYNFLEEFLFLLDSEGFVLSLIKEIEIKDNKLRAVVLGDSAENYKFSNDVKAITYNDMFVREEKGKFIIEGVFDV